MQELFRGDSWDFEYKIKDANGVDIDVTGWGIICAIQTSSEDLIEKKNSVAGGSDSEIKILDTTGRILVQFTKEETEEVALDKLTLEVEITSPQGKRYTVSQDEYKVKDTIIKH